MVKYIVQPGDTLGNIAYKYRTTVQAIMKANGIKDPNMIHVGQIIRIPTDSYQPSSKLHHGHHYGSKGNPGNPGNPGSSWHHDDYHHKYEHYDD
jgi:LysM repeat protein